MPGEPIPSSTDRCSIARTLEAVGDRWTLLILRDLFRGVRRFERLHGDLGIARNLLTDRLRRLEEAGVVQRVPYQERPVRHEYRLTAKGRDLSPALVALMAWGDRWCAEDGPPTLLIHDACHGPVEHAVRCPTCDEAVAAQHIRSRPGPGHHARATGAVR
ncbi:MAG TPA: helix-turn-helix domain-containing protein [Acidimicrobiales bacterium]|jgi:DNA-binding HxlR family transcriptional regulator|nr:helix-turn-helix transcriptional regulator [Actinomycetes bacterium]MDP6105682.1 helix-turn-helix domain-containing protein [Acidimicrobiales bacterium]HJM31906.1 helix-turn-helix domain-containing protein [Acidimicrobiales bacterium]|tara:strand:- start:10087 stop:10566 length:480 start_codon:yes stop_codon:yes gene_type:complete